MLIGRKNTQLFIAALLSLLFSGCQSIPPDNISKFSQGLTQAHLQTVATFRYVNALGREQSIEYILLHNKPNIDEADFTPALESKDIATWDFTFFIMEKYTSALEKLLSSDQSTKFGDAALALNTQLKSFPATHNISSPLTTAFIQLGKKIIDLKSEHDAKIIMRGVDADIREILTQLATSIGSDPDNKDGIRGTVWSNSTTKLNTGPRVDYVNAIKNGSSKDKKRPILQSFATIMDQRDAQLSALSSLRLSILGLANLHTAIVKDTAIDAENLISIINYQLNQTQLLLSTNKTTDGTAANSKN